MADKDLSLVTISSLVSFLCNPTILFLEYSTCHDNVLHCYNSKKDYLLLLKTRWPGLFSLNPFLKLLTIFIWISNLFCSFAFANLYVVNILLTNYKTRFWHLFHRFNFNCLFLSQPSRSAKLLKYNKSNQSFDFFVSLHFYNSTTKYKIYQCIFKFRSLKRL